MVAPYRLVEAAVDKFTPDLTAVQRQEEPAQSLR